MTDVRNPLKDFPSEKEWWLGEKALKWYKINQQQILDMLEIINSLPKNYNDFNIHEFYEKVDELKQKYPEEN